MAESRSTWQRMIDSFKPAETQPSRLRSARSRYDSADDRADSKQKDLMSGSETKALENLDSTSQEVEDQDARYNKDLSVRHLLTLAVGGAIGTGLFVNSGAALTTGGPGSLVIDWVIISTCLFTIVNALGELSSTFPVVGGFNVYISRFVEPSFGFAVNLNYLAQWAVLLPLELVAASLTIRYWNHTINSDAWVAIFYTIILLANLLDVKSFGETEFVLSMVKILAIIGFTILGIVLTCGGGPKGGYIGGKYWSNPGAFVGHTAGDRFHGLCSVFVTAAFSYSGTELIAVSAAESVNPRITLPKACKRTFWLITVCYIVVLTLVGCLVSSDDPRLLNGSSSVDVAASPLVIAIENGGIKGLPSLMNAIILIAVLSVANSAVYACSRCMASMAQIGNLPKVFTYVDRKGRPLYAIVATLIFGLLSFIAASDKQEEVFTWLSALSGLSTLFCWFAINVSHIRFRRTMKERGRTLDELPFVSMTGVWGSYYGCIVIFIVLVVCFWTSLFPGGGEGANAESFFETYLSFPILLACYFGHKLYTRSWRLLTPTKEIDLDSGRRAVDLELMKDEKRIEEQAMRQKSLFARFIHLWC
ncbi:histidine permease [Lachancea thermotolerans CBS 6340]|uniref:KLTH0B02046p n=1 Tax=Lachancea thermotolerans (strain ATCC 56472 / CBS 6340 / NRRL Y-8284) TaxID=559295 RepID=C5DCD1_LACTC|nr:KLTH0B02046p [Lachancea thermotolerans CBS 6340]CAR21442.1 KLTH0B02046p [Lachancea thermotolerans CBS 6340]